MRPIFSFTQQYNIRWQCEGKYFCINQGVYDWSNVEFFFLNFKLIRRVSISFNFRNESKNKWRQSLYQVLTVAFDMQLNRFLEITWISRNFLSAGNTRKTCCISYYKIKIKRKQLLVKLNNYSAFSSSVFCERRSIWFNFSVKNYIELQNWKRLGLEKLCS